MQGGVDRHGVGGRVERMEHGQGIEHLAAPKEGAAAFDPVRQAGLAQRLLVVTDVGKRGQQHGDVARHRGAPLEAVAGVHPPTQAVHVGQQAGDDLGLAPAEIGRRRRARGALGLGAGRRAHDHHVAAGLAVVPVGRQRRVARLQARLRHGADEAVEHAVDPGDHRRHRAKVLPQGLDAAALPDHELGDLVVHGYVGAPEPVDGLHGVAHQKELARL